MTRTRVYVFDRGAPDPSPRPGADLHFSHRCGCNAIEWAARVLAGRAPHPKQFLSGQKLIWIDQITGEEIPPPFTGEEVPAP